MDKDIPKEINPLVRISAGGAAGQAASCHRVRPCVCVHAADAGAGGGCLRARVRLRARCQCFSTYSYYQQAASHYRL